MRISIVTTMYKSAPYLVEFHERVKREVLKITGDYEMIFINDGSPDNSLDVALCVRESDGKVIVVDLSRNFGHQHAMMYGLSCASGDLVFLLDCDLEEDPEYLGIFHQRYLRGDCDVVFGVQEKRKGGPFERVTGHLFYKIINYLADLNMAENMITARLMNASYVKSLVSHEEKDVFIGGLWQITGYRQEQVKITKHSKGESTYNLKRKISLLVTSITSFSDKPLVYIFNIGLFIFALSMLFVAELLVKHYMGWTDVSGWTSLIVSIWLLGGMTICFLGVIGVYLSKIYIEVKRRPATIVKKYYGKKNEK